MDAANVSHIGSHDTMQQIINSIAIPALIIRRTRVHMVNTALCDLLQYPSASLTKQHIFDLIHPRSHNAALKLYLQASQHPHANNAVLRLQPQDARICWARARLRPALYAGQDRWLVTLTNITQQLIPETGYDQNMIEHLPIGVYRALLDGTIVYSNPTHAQLLGYDRVQEVLDDEEEWPFVEANLADEMREQLIAQPGHYIESQLQILRKDHTKIWVHHTARAVADQGEIIYTEGTLSDISDEKMQEARLRRRNQTLEALNAIAITLGQTLDLNECLEKILAYSKDVIPYDSATISLVDDEEMEFIATRGLPESLNRVLDTILEERHKPDNYGYKVIANQQIIRLADVQAAQEWVHRAETDYIRSWMGVPLIYQDRVIGVMTFDHKRPNFYTQAHETSAQAIAQQAAIAISNMRFYERTQTEITERERTEMYLVENLQRMDTLYQIMHMLMATDQIDADLYSILAVIKRAMHVDSIWLVTFDLETGKISHQVSVDEAAATVEADFCHITSTQTITMPDADIDQHQSIVTPLPAERQGLAAVVAKRGLLTLSRASEQPPFDENDRELLVAIANQLTMALENQALYARLRHQAELLEHRVIVSQQRLQAILDATAEGIIYMEDFVIQYSNPAFNQMLRYSEADLIGKPLSAIRKQYQVRGGSDFNFDFDSLEEEVPVNDWNDALLIRSDGHVVHTSMIFNLIGEPGDDMVRMVAVVRDITQERNLHQQRMNFVANAAHELRTPLTSFGLRLHMLRRQPERMEVHLSSLERVADYLRSVVEELLDLARFEQGTVIISRDNYALQPIIEQAALSQAEYAREKEIEVRLDTPTDPIFAFVDSRRYLQLTSNLIVNALNYVDNGGHVLVRLRETRLNDQRFVELFVEDDGKPIDEALLPRQIFEPFSRPGLGTQRETGMGLAIAREIVQIHDGIIRAESSNDDNNINIYYARLPGDRIE